MEAVIKIIDNAEKSIDNNIGDVQVKLLKELEKILIENNIKGNLVFTEEGSNNLREKIKQAFREAGWVDTVDNYITFYALLQDAMFKEYRIREFSARNAEIRKEEAIKRLKGSYFINDVVNVIENTIRQGMLNGVTYTEQQNILVNEFEQKGLIKDYVRVNAIDAINQYAGAINQEIKDKFGFTKMRYIESLKNTSRPLCIHLRGKVSWTEDELKKVLEEYCPGGIPSDSTVTIDRFDGKKQVMKKGSGIIEGTNIENFTVLRGGYQCGHIARWSK